MALFAQKHTKITTFYLIRREPQDMRAKLRFHSKWKKSVLVVPLLASEFTKQENRPVFENMVRNLKEVKYLSHIIFGLDGATDEEAGRLTALRDELIPVTAIRRLIERSPDRGRIELHEVDDDHNLHESLGLMLAVIEQLKAEISGVKR